MGVSSGTVLPLLLLPDAPCHCDEPAEMEKTRFRLTKIGN